MRFQLTFPTGWATHNGKQAVVAVSPGKDAVVELGAAAGTSADAAARAFLAQEGITGGSTSRSTQSGLRAVSAPFGATTENGTLRGMVLFVEHGGAVYGLIGYTPDARWSTYQAAIDQTLRSFQPLTDRTALNVQPHRLDIVTLDRRTTIEALARQRPSPVSTATLALINRVGLQTPLESGRLIKWVVGQPLPSTD
jgi:predicted Zn-dependent protease